MTIGIMAIVYVVLVHFVTFFRTFYSTDRIVEQLFFLFHPSIIVHFCQQLLEGNGRSVKRLKIGFRPVFTVHLILFTNNKNRRDVYLCKCIKVWKMEQKQKHVSQKGWSSRFLQELIIKNKQTIGSGKKIRDAKETCKNTYYVILLKG